MGIDGLLTLLKPLVKKQHISEFRSKNLGVDALPWIYKGIYGANIQMGDNANENPHAFLYYIIEMIDMLQFYKIKPIFIFDGSSLQAKHKTLEKRKKAKQQQKKKAQEQLQNNQVQKSKKTMARYLNVDQEKLILVMSMLKSKNIDFVVAPFQADSQICKLYKLGVIDAVITEDSDLIVYGVDVMLKLKETGQCDYLSLKVDKEDVQKHQCAFLNKFCKFNRQKRVQAAILSGCDYVDSVKGIGIKKAIKLVDQNQTLQKMVESLKKDVKFCQKVPQNYLDLIKKAKFIFLFAKTFNPITNQLQYLDKDLILQRSEFNEMTVAQLNHIVGNNYEFREDHYYGKINCKTQQQREFKDISLQQIYSLNRENLNFLSCLEKEKQSKIKKQLKEQIIDETTSLCWEEDSVSEGLIFLLQKQIIGQYFTKFQPKKSQLSQINQASQTDQKIQNNRATQTNKMGQTSSINQANKSNSQSQQS